MIKIICCDIDGTLLRDDKSLPDENIKWIKKVVSEQNILFSFISGRMPSGIRQFHNIIGINGPISCFNGCSYYDENDNLVSERRMDRKTSSLILQTARTLELELIFFDGNKWYLESKDGYIYPRKVKLYACEPHIGKMEDLLNEFCPNKILTMSSDINILKEFDKKLIKKGIDSKAVTKYANQDFFEIMPPNVNKGCAIDDICTHYSFDKSEIMAIGDDFNDEAMLEKAGLAVAMQNSVDPLLKKADYITDTNNNAGVAKAIKKFFYE